MLKNVVNAELKWNARLDPLTLRIYTYKKLTWLNDKIKVYKFIFQCERSVYICIYTMLLLNIYMINGLSIYLLKFWKITSFFGLQNCVLPTLTSVITSMLLVVYCSNYSEKRCFFLFRNLVVNSVLFFPLLLVRFLEK